MFVLKGEVQNQEVYFVDIDKQNIFNTDWDVRACSEYLDNAKKYQFKNAALNDLKKLNDSFRLVPLCPRCGNDYEEPPAISRSDNKTKICPTCGISEAIENYNKK